MPDFQRIRAIDSHTGGEPTRVVIAGFPQLGTGSMAERLDIFKRDHDSLQRDSVILYAARSETSSNSWNLCVMSVASESACVVLSLLRVSSMAALKAAKLG